MSTLSSGVVSRKPAVPRGGDGMLEMSNVRGHVHCNQWRLLAECPVGGAIEFWLKVAWNKEVGCSSSSHSHTSRSCIQDDITKSNLTDSRVWCPQWINEHLHLYSSAWWSTWVSSSSGRQKCIQGHIMYFSLSFSLSYSLSACFMGYWTYCYFISTSICWWWHCVNIFPNILDSKIVPISDIVFFFPGILAEIRFVI